MRQYSTVLKKVLVSMAFLSLGFTSANSFALESGIAKRVKILMNSLVFKADFYRSKYPDLAGLTNDQLAKHWIDFGFDERRQGSAAFSALYYINNNTDVKNAFGGNLQDSTEHFINKGASEGRPTSPIFNAVHYLNRYPDLQKVYGSTNYKMATFHFNTYGYFEGRNGK